MHEAAHSLVGRREPTERPAPQNPGFLRSLPGVAFAALLPSLAQAQVVPPDAPRSAPSAVQPADAGTVGAATRAAATVDYPDDPRLQVALRMLGSGSLDLARMTAATVRAERPDCDRAAAIEGIALNKLKRYEEARALLDRARRSTQPFPEQRHAAHFLGWCHYHLGQLEESRTAFEEHLKSVPNEPDSTFGLGLIALDEDRLDDADRLFVRALEAFSAPRDRPVDRARVLARMADAALRRDDVVGAESLLRRSIEASAVQHETWSKLARVSDRLGKTTEADAARANADRILVALGRKSGETSGQSSGSKENAPGGDTNKPEPAPRGDGGDQKPTEATDEPNSPTKPVAP